MYVEKLNLPTRFYLLVFEIILICKNVLFSIDTDTNNNHLPLFSNIFSSLFLDKYSILNLNLQRDSSYTAVGKKSCVPPSVEKKSVVIPRNGA